MIDYISRDAALDMELTVECDPDELQPIMRGMNLVFEHIKGLPSVLWSKLDRPTSNADKIRSMTDYEMADWIANILNHCDNKDAGEDCLESCPLYACCNLPYDNIEAWLQEPAERREE